MIWRKPIFLTLTVAFFQAVFTGATLGETCQTPYDASDSSITICDLGVLDGGSFSFALAASDDGTVIVGYGGTPEGDRAFRWTQATGMVNLGTLPGGDFSSMAFDVSSDGRTIVGFGDSADGYYSFIWTEDTGMERIDVEGFKGSAISGDGRVVVGYLGDPLLGQTPAYWSRETGIVKLDPDGVFNGRTAFDVSYDGSVIVGHAPPFGFRWSATEGMVMLTPPSETGGVSAKVISGDGRIIAGSFVDDTGRRSVQWNSRGNVELAVPEFGRVRNDISGISRDGQFVVGRVKFGEHYQAYARRMGQPPVILGDLGGFVTDEGSFFSSKAYAMDAYGNLVVGSSTGPDGSRAVRWLINILPNG